MFRGPDHIATRTTSLTLDLRSPSTLADRRWRESSGWRDACRHVGVEELVVQGLKALDHRPAAAIADRASVHGPDGHDAGERAGDEGLAGGVDVGEAERRLARRDAAGAAGLQDV